MTEMGASLDQLTEEHFSSTFREFDTNGSGTIEKNEMANYMKRLIGL